MFWWKCKMSKENKKSYLARNGCAPSGMASWEGASYTYTKESTFTILMTCSWTLAMSCKVAGCIVSPWVMTNLKIMLVLISPAVSKITGAILWNCHAHLTQSDTHLIVLAGYWWKCDFVFVALCRANFKLLSNVFDGDVIPVFVVSDSTFSYYVSNLNAVLPLVT